MSAENLLNVLFNAGVAVSILATVASLGMSFTVSQLLAPLRRVWVVVIAVVLNAAVIPAVAWGVAVLLPIADSNVGGLTLAAIGAAGAAGLKAAQLSKRADLPLAVSLVVVLQLVNIVAVPLWAGVVVSGASLSAGEIVKNLLLLVLLPLAIGLLVRVRYAEHAAGWQDGLVKVANIALLIALVAGVAVNWQVIVSLFGSWVLLASVLIAVLAVGLGTLVGPREAPVRTAGALISGMRFASLGLIIIGSQLGGNPDYLAPALVFSLVNLVVGMLVAVEIGRRGGAGKDRFAFPG